MAPASRQVNLQIRIALELTKSQTVTFARNAGIMAAARDVNLSVSFRRRV